MFSSSRSQHQEKDRREAAFRFSQSGYCDTCQSGYQTLGSHVVSESHLSILDKAERTKKRDDQRRRKRQKRLNNQPDPESAKKRKSRWQDNVIELFYDANDPSKTSRAYPSEISTASSLCTPPRCRQGGAAAKSTSIVDVH